MFRYTRKFIPLFIAALFLIIYPQPSFAALSATLPLRLAWDRNTESDLAYYRVYYGTSSRNYNHSITVDKQYPSCTLDESHLAVGQTYYIALTALDFSLNESGYSDELVVSIESSSTTTATMSSVIEAEEMSYHTNGVQQGEYWLLWGNGTMNEDVYFPDTDSYRFEIIAKGDLAYGVGPEMELLIDGEIKDTVFVNTTTPETFVFNVNISAGTHEFAIGFYNDVWNPLVGIDRNLYVDKTIIIPASGNVSSTTTTRQTTTTTTTSPTSTITTTTIPTSTTTTTTSPTSTITTTTIPTSTTTTTIITNQKEYCSADDVLILHSSIPEEGTMSITISDDLENAISASLFLTLWDPDIAGEGYIYINENGPIDLPVGNYDNLVHSFEVLIDVDWLIKGENSLRFTHVATMGYEVRELCVRVLFTTYPETTTTVPSPYTTTITPDDIPPTGTVIINKGDETTYSRLVTLHLSAEDDESGMGVGAQMCFSNDCTEWSPPQAFASTKEWVLSAGEGEKTVYAKFCDVVGNWMPQPASDNIKLETDLSCPKPIQLDTTAIESSGDFLPLWSKGKAVDGKTNTGWLSPLRLSMHDEYITLDLGEIKIVNRIDIFSNPFLFLNLFPLEFQIQVSTDNENWTEVFTEKDYSITPSYTDSWIFDEIKARYMKMAITRAKPFLLFFYLTYIAEIEVHGCSETEIPESQFTSMAPLDQTKTRVVKLTPTMKTTDKKKPLSTRVPPGTPGRPVFIIDNHPQPSGKR